MILNYLDKAKQIEKIFVLFDLLVLPLLMFLMVFRSFQLMDKIKVNNRDEKILIQIKAIERMNNFRDPRYVYLLTWVVFIFCFIYIKFIE